MKTQNIIQILTTVLFTYIATLLYVVKVPEPNYYWPTVVLAVLILVLSARKMAKALINGKDE